MNDQEVGPTSERTTELTVIAGRGEYARSSVTLVAAATAFALGVAGFAFGESDIALLVCVALAQAVGVAAWWLSGSVESLSFALVGLAVAVAADITALVADPAPPGLALVVAGGFAAAVVAQLSRRYGRRKVAAALAAAMSVTVVMVGLATLLVLAADDPAVVRAAMASTGAALVVARGVDFVTTSLRPDPSVPRSLVGLLIGWLVGVAAGVMSWAAVGDGGVGHGALLGGAVATVALLGDLAVSYSIAEQTLSDVDSGTAARRPIHALMLSVLGPIVGFAVVGPIGYLIAPILAQ